MNQQGATGIEIDWDHMSVSSGEVIDNKHTTKLGEGFCSTRQRPLSPMAMCRAAGVRTSVIFEPLDTQLLDAFAPVFGGPDGGRCD